MADENGCNCIEIQPKDSPSIKVCSNNLGKLFFGALAVATIIVIADKLSE